MNNAGKTINSYLGLSKLRIMIPVSLTGFTGYFIFIPQFTSKIFLVTAGILLMAISASVLNQIQEAGPDSKMSRTHNRPIPTGRISIRNAFVYMVILLLAGAALVYFAGNLKAMLTGLITVIIYNGIYTPLKRITPFAAVPGALTGALPPAIGWVAAGGGIFDRPVVLIGFLLFMGQIPHFWLLIVKYGEDYRAAGMPSLTAVLNNRQIKRLIFTWVLTSVAAALFLCFFEIIRMRVLVSVLLVASVFLIWKFSGLLKDSSDNSISSSYSVLLNSYFLLIMILLIADRMSVHGP